MFQERRDSRAPALGRALKERALVMKGNRISQTHVHTQQPAGSWEDGAPQGAPDEVLGTPSSLDACTSLSAPVVRITSHVLDGGRDRPSWGAGAGPAKRDSGLGLGTPCCALSVLGSLWLESLSFTSWPLLFAVKKKIPKTLK